MKIKLKNLYYIIMCIFLVRPYFIQLNPGINSIWAYLTLFFAILGTISVLKQKKFQHIILCLLLCFIYTLSTLIYQPLRVSSAISTTAQIILACDLGILVFTNKYTYDAKKILSNVISIYLYLDVFFGFLSIFFGIVNLGREYTFLGYDNYAIYIIFPFIIVKWALDYCINGKLLVEDYICFFLCFLYKVFTLSFNAIIMSGLFIVLLIIFNKFTYIKRFINAKNGAIVSVVLLVGVYKFQIHNIFARWLLSMGKGTTLGYRTVIWGKTIPTLLKAPLLGYGVLVGANDNQNFNGTFQQRVGLTVWDVQANHSHNLFLDIWYTVGIVGLVIFILFFIKTIKGVAKISDNNLKYLISVGIFVFMLLSFIDGYPYLSSIYLLFIVCMNIHELIDKEKLGD